MVLGEKETVLFREYRSGFTIFLSTAGGVGCYYLGGLVGNVQTSDACLELLQTVPRRLCNQTYWIVHVRAQNSHRPGITGLSRHIIN